VKLSMSRAGSVNFTLILPADSNLESIRLYDEIQKKRGLCYKSSSR
jgi:hypothetical protein